MSGPSRCFMSRTLPHQVRITCLATLSQPHTGRVCGLSQLSSEVGLRRVDVERPLRSRRDRRGARRWGPTAGSRSAPHLVHDRLVPRARRQASPARHDDGATDWPVSGSHS